MIHLFPKSHVVAATAIGALLVLVLILSPSSNVNATRTTIPLDISSTSSEQLDAAQAALAAIDAASLQQKATQTAKDDGWENFLVRDGDTLSDLFKNAGFNDQVMYNVLGTQSKQHDLSRIYPGQTISFHKAEIGELAAVKLQLSKLETFLFTKDTSGEFKKTIENKKTDIHVAYAEGSIQSSLFAAGERSGLSQAQILELAGIFAWDIDFALDIREGDSFQLIYEELFVDGEKFKNGRILAAAFTNDGHKYEAVLYKQKDGNSNYYTPKGNSMRKAFIRTPVDFARISSHFNPNRKHPVLHKIRAHKGTDYAAATGTPIKASGDGKIIHAGIKGGYGKTVMIQHGQSITTLYAHMSNYAKGIKVGSRIRQGQIIGYVGSTGLASGPHLHYEFQVAGAHKNPVSVPLPQAEPIASTELAAFKAQTSIYLSQLETIRDSYQVAKRN